jgi:hypothetical protein
LAKAKGKAVKGAAVAGKKGAKLMKSFTKMAAK